METIVGLRIRNSRIQKGLSLQEVAEKVGVSKQMVSKYEKGISMPGSDKLIMFSKLFGQKIDYFFREPVFEIGNINFRKKSNFSVKKVNSLKEEIRIQIENYLYVENICSLEPRFINPISDIKINSMQDVVEATNELRKSWDIGDDTIHNIIQLLEDKEIKIIEVEDDSNRFDGLATKVNEEYQIIVINKNMPLERKRFTLLHELGHILLNYSSNDVKEQEKYCNYFASEMLLSERNLKIEFGGKRSTIALEELKNIQEKYGISIRAIMYKLGELKIISQEKLTSFYKKLNMDNSLKQIIDSSRFDSIEYSYRYKNLVYRSVSEEFISLSKASSLLNVSLEEFKTNFSLNIK